MFTVGITRFSPKPADLSPESDFSFAVGGGMKIPLYSRVALRLEARGYVTLLNAASTIFCSSSPAASTCNIRVKANTFFQAQGLLGVTFGF